MADLTVDEQRDRARDLRVDGKSYSAIAKDLGIPLERAFQYVREGTRLPSLKVIRETEHAVSVERIDRAVVQMIDVITETDESGNATHDTEVRVKATNALVALESVGWATATGEPRDESAGYKQQVARERK